MRDPSNKLQTRPNRMPLGKSNIIDGPFWSELRIFLAVAKANSFFQAAEALGMSRPAVSRHVKRLQDLMDAQLVVPTPSGVKLTERGQELAHSLVSLDQKLDMLSTSIRTENQGGRTTAGARDARQNRQKVEPEPTPFVAGARARAALLGRARAALLGKEIAAKDLAASGGSYSLEEVRRLLNSVSRQSIGKRVREGRLLAVVGVNNRRFYPVAQFNADNTIVEGLRDVQDAMATRNGYAVLNFLVNPDPRLDNRKPVDLLRQGQIEQVVKAAALLGEPGA